MTNAEKKEALGMISIYEQYINNKQNSVSINAILAAKDNFGEELYSKYESMQGMDTETFQQQPVEDRELFTKIYTFIEDYTFYSRRIRLTEEMPDVESDIMKYTKNNKVISFYSGIYANVWRTFTEQEKIHYVKQLEMHYKFNGRKKNQQENTHGL